jgi:hypothetical protein
MVLAGTAIGVVVGQPSFFENRRMRTKPLWCALWRYAFTETRDTASRWPHLARPAFIVQDFASGEIASAGPGYRRHVLDNRMLRHLRGGVRLNRRYL